MASEMDLWLWNAEADAMSVAGYKVVANDGEIGRIDRATGSEGSAHIVVDTGGWILGHKSLIPASAIRDINHDSETVQVDLTKDEIRNAPEYDDESGYDAYREDAGLYYGRLRMPPL